MWLIYSLLFHHEDQYGVLDKGELYIFKEGSSLLLLHFIDFRTTRCSWVVVLFVSCLHVLLLSKFCCVFHTKMGHSFLLTTNANVYRESLNFHIILTNVDVTEYLIYFTWPMSVYSEFDYVTISIVLHFQRNDFREKVFIMTMTDNYTSLFIPFSC